MPTEETSEHAWRPKESTASNRLVELAAKSAICLELASRPIGADTAIYEKDADRIMAPASITKLLTAVVAIKIAEMAQLPKDFRLEAIAADDIPGSGRNICAGDRLSFSDGIVNLLVPSSNVTANIIARTFGRILLGSETNESAAAVQRFVAEMNFVARNLGMARSQFMNPHGLAARGQRSTARDLSALVKECLLYVSITRVWGCRAYAIGISGPASRRLVVRSTFHSSMRQDVPDSSLPRYLGGKTGSLWPSVFNLAALSENKNRRTRISVILGSPTIADRYRDYRRLESIDNA